MTRINLFGGPGSGKTTTCARVFAELKERKVSVEQVTEYVKAWAYRKRTIHSLDQVYLFGKQMEYEHRFLSCGVRNTITDSPTFQSVVYAHMYAPKLVGPLSELCRAYDEEYPPLNIFIRRGNKDYVSEGRYQSYEQAKEIDNHILDMLVTFYPRQVKLLDYQDQQGILDFILAHVD